MMWGRRCGLRVSSRCVVFWMQQIRVYILFNGGPMNHPSSPQRGVARLRQRPGRRMRRVCTGILVHHDQTVRKRVAWGRGRGECARVDCYVTLHANICVGGALDRERGGHPAHLYSHHKASRRYRVSCVVRELVSFCLWLLPRPSQSPPRGTVAPTPAL